MWRDTIFFVLLSFVSLTVADLPSCYRARCSHCRIPFIAQMCPQICTGCPPSNLGKAVNNAGTINLVVHAKPTVYRTSEHIHTLSQEDGQIQNGQQFSQYQAPAPQQTSVQPSPRFQASEQQLSPPGFHSPGQQQFSPLPQFFNNQYSQQQPFGQQSFGQQPFGQQTQFTFPPTPTFAPSQFNSFQPEQQQPSQFGNFGQTSLTQHAASSVFNPFQPFVHQPFQTQPQQQTAYNPFTFPTLPPSATFAPFTVPPVTLPTVGTFPPFLTHSPLTQAPLGTQAPPSITYQQPQTSDQQTFWNNNVQSGQTSSPQIVEPQRIRQIYNTQQQIGTQQASLPYVSGQQPYLQPAHSNSIPTVQVGAKTQPARSIDAAPVHLEKQAYFGKETSPALVNQCPKQPNYEPCISKELANERFRNCCLRLGEGCSQLCNYDQSLTILQLAVLTGRCPIGKVADMMICASGYEDATPCCQAYGVFEPGFEHCRPYCNPAAGLPNDGMLAEKYKCLGKLQQIQRCFYVSQRP